MKNGFPIEIQTKKWPYNKWLHGRDLYWTAIVTFSQMWINPGNKIIMISYIGRRIIIVITWTAVVKYYFYEYLWQTSWPLGKLPSQCNKINKQTYHSLHPKMRQEQITGHQLLQASSVSDHSDKDQGLVCPYQGELIPKHTNKGKSWKFDWLLLIKNNIIC